METGLPCCPSSPHLHRDTSKVPLDCLHFHIRQFYSKCSRSRSGLVGCLGHHMTLLLWCFCVGLGRINLTAFIGRLPPSSLVSCPCVFLSPLFFIPSPRLASPSHRLCTWLGSPRLLSPTVVTNSDDQFSSTTGSKEQESQDGTSHCQWALPLAHLLQERICPRSYSSLGQGWDLSPVLWTPSLDSLHCAMH